jgi:hypothetical protein
MFSRKITNAPEKQDAQTKTDSLGPKPLFLSRLLERVSNRLEKAGATFSLGVRQTITGIGMVATVMSCNPTSSPVAPIDDTFDYSTNLLGFGQDTLIGKYRIKTRYLLPQTLTDSVRVANVLIIDTSRALNKWEYWLTKDSMVTAFEYTKIDTNGIALDSAKGFNFKCLDIVDSNATYADGAAKYRIWRDW